jgi:hypothetical protein
MSCPRGCCSSTKEHLRSISFTWKAAPQVNARERILSRDLAAYKSLTEDGLEPKGIDGMHELVTRDAPAHVIEGQPPPEIKELVT